MPRVVPLAKVIFFHFLIQANCNKSHGSQTKLEIVPFLVCKLKSVSPAFLFPPCPRLQVQQNLGKTGKQRMGLRGETVRE